MEASAALRAVLLEALALKALPRAGWLHAGVEQPESVAAHSWGVAWLVLALCPEGVDLGRALAIAVVHDLAEVRVGDITPRDGVAPDEKAAREQAALRALVAPLAAAAELEFKLEHISEFLKHDDRKRFLNKGLVPADRVDDSINATLEVFGDSSTRLVWIDGAVNVITDDGRHWRIAPHLLSKVKDVTPAKKSGSTIFAPLPNTRPSASSRAETFKRCCWRGS